MSRIIVILSALVLVFGLAIADGGDYPAPEGEAYGVYGCTLVFGGGQGTPGEMMQYLRDRTEAFSGNPYEVVEYYGEWANVGELIAAKCGD